MSDDLRDAFGEDIFAEPEEGDTFEEEAGEAQNKTFLIAVAALGGLLFLAIGVFILWALVLNPRMQAQQAAQNASIQATNTEVVKQNGNAEAAAAAGAGSGEEDVRAEETTEEPTDAPEPTVTLTPTPVIKATNTPTLVPTEESGDPEGEGEGEEEETAEPTATPEPRRTPTPTRTPRPTPTPKEALGSSSDTGSGTEATPETGLGEFLLIVVAALLLGLIIFARRLRKV